MWLPLDSLISQVRLSVHPGPRLPWARGVSTDPTLLPGACHRSFGSAQSAAPVLLKVANGLRFYQWQNLGEAEYIVSLFCYLRLRGHPAHTISILTTYNGQKHLIRDVIEQRCAAHPALGRPRKVGNGLWAVGVSKCIVTTSSACAGGDRGQVPGPAEQHHSA